jgi:2-dehydro-3-deoxyphosphogluconate aldolase/(4S)-4-hydroxy-2-oxoglutarate aldolase
MAVGGIDETNLADYLKVGCVGAGLGGSLVHKTWIAQGEFDKITQAAQRLVKIVKDE